MKTSVSMLLAGIVVTVSGAAFAASTPEAVLADPNRHAVEVAGELGVTPLQFATCFAGVTPATTAAELNGGRERDNKAILLPCLQAINPSITNDFLDGVMDKYRGPAPR